METCSVTGCQGKHKCGGYCNKHYQQMRLYGKIKEKLILNSNNFIINNNICWIVLYNQKYIEIARAKFYTKYYNQIKDSELTWYLSDNGYIRANWNDENNQKHTTSLHEAIIQLSGQIIPDDKEIDHRDRDKLNCLDENLRFCTRSQNNQNREKFKNNTSNEKGVSWYKITQKWRARIGVNNKPKHLGYFDTKEEATEAYNKAAIENFGEFAVLNKV